MKISTKIYMLQGPPACGKSTLALQLYFEDKTHRVIVCRDSFREGRGEYWIPQQEKYIDALEELAVRTALVNKLSPIIDATNLNPKTIDKWKSIASAFHVELITLECVLPYKEALLRDKNRERSVGEKVLRKFYGKYYPDLLHPKDDRKMLSFTDKPKAIIVDVDGTLALRQNRSPYDYEKVGEDKVDFRMADLVHQLIENVDYEVFFITGREDIGNCRKLTEQWLDTNIYSKHWYNFGNIPEDNWHLYMRSKDDHRPDDVVKKEIYENRIAPWYDVVVVFDDRDKVVKMWRDLGLLCCQVYYGNF